jgi:hypothetical protein
MQMAPSNSPENADGSENLKKWGFHPAPMIDSMLDMQKQSLEYAAELSQAFITRAQSESKLATDLVSKLAAARSVPESACAWQECIQKQMQLNAEDALRLLDQNKRLMEVGADLLSNGGSGTAT